MTVFGENSNAPLEPRVATLEQRANGFDTALAGQATSQQAALDQEASARDSGDDSLDAAIVAERAARLAGDQANSDRIGDAVARLDGVDDALAAALAQVAADRTQTGLDRVATGLDRTATAADRVQTGLDRTATGVDRTATGADRTQTGLDRTATGADRTQTGLDRTATGADRAAVAALLAATTGLNIYVSSIKNADGTFAGNDANDGLSSTTKVRTLARARALAVNNCTIWMDGGSIWYAECIDWSALKGVNFRRYGQGPWPRWTARSSLAGQTWTQPDPTGTPNLWTTRVTPPNNTDNPGGVAINSASSSIWQPALYDERDAHRRIEDCGIPIYVAGADRAACIAYVAANPNTYYCAIVGDSHVDPRTSGVSGTQIDYWINLSDGGNPNGKEITHVDQRRIAMAGGDSTCDGLTVECTGNKDGMSVASGSLNSTPGHWQNFEFKEAAIHGGVWSGVNRTNWSVYGAYHGGPIRQNGGGVHDFRATGTQARSRGVQMKNIRVRGFYIAFYSHGAGSYTGSSGEHEFIDIDGALVEDCAYVASYATENQNRGVTIRNLRAFNITAQVCDFGAYVPVTSFANNSYVFEDCRIFMAPTGGLSLFADQGPDAKITLRRTTIYAPSNSGIMGNASGITDPAHFTALTLDKSMIIGSFSIQGANRENWSAVLVNGSYLGVLNDGAGPLIAGTLTADATSIIECSNSAPEDLVARYGSSVNAGVITGVAKQVITRTIVDADLTYFNLTGGHVMSYSGTPLSGSAGAVGSTATFTIEANANAYTIGRQIKIGANTYRVLNHNGGSTNSIVVTPSPAGAFTNQSWTTACFNRKLFGGAMAGTAKVSKDGTQIAVPTGSGPLFTVGLTIGLRVATLLGATVRAVRKVSAVSGDIVTLDRAIRGASFSPGSFQGIDGTNPGSLPLPTATIEFFPLIYGPSSFRPTYSVSFVDSITATGDVVEYNGYQAFTDFTTAPVRIDPYRRTDGSRWFLDGTTPIIDHETGAVDFGIQLATGDQVTFTFRADIAEQRLANNLAADPYVAGQVLVRHAPTSGDIGGTEYSRRRIGYQRRS